MTGAGLVSRKLAGYFNRKILLKIVIFQILKCIFFVKSFEAKPFKAMLFVLCRSKTTIKILSRTVALSYYVTDVLIFNMLAIDNRYMGEFSSLVNRLN